TGIIVSPVPASNKIRNKITFFIIHTLKWSRVNLPHLLLAPQSIVLPPDEVVLEDFLMPLPSYCPRLHYVCFSIHQDYQKVLRSSHKQLHLKRPYVLTKRY